MYQMEQAAYFAALSLTLSLEYYNLHIGLNSCGCKMEILFLIVTNLQCFSEGQHEDIQISKKNPPNMIQRDHSSSLP